MDRERLKKQLDFVLEIDKEKNILRQTHLTDYRRQENDAEHAWHMAIMIYLLKEYANEEFDVAKAMMMALIHDIVEIDAGDTYAYDAAGNESKRQREETAADRIFNILPREQAEKMRALWEEFEECNTSEARFARALDNVQPVMLNDATDGKAWREHQVELNQVQKRNEKTKTGSQELWEYVTNLFYENVKKGNIIDK